MAAPPEFLTSLGVALSRLSEQLGEASKAYQDCLARYAEEKLQVEKEAEYGWGEEQEGRVEEEEEAALEGGGPDAQIGAAADFEAPREDARPPAALPQPQRTPFFVAPALPAPKGDACPQALQKPWTKVVRVEPEHGAADHALAEAKAAVGAFLNCGTCKVSASHPIEVVMGQDYSDTVDVQNTCSVDKMIGQRLLARLGKRSTKALVSGHDLHQAVSAMGLERYSLKEMNHLVCRMSALINLEFRQTDRQGATSSISHHHLRRSPSELTALAERADWSWPEPCKDGPRQRGPMAPQHHNEPAAPMEQQQDALVPIKALIKAMTEQDVVLKKFFGAVLCEQIFAIKEVLVTGDANRLVSELTCVRIDDLATRTPEAEFSVLELILGVAIIANGILVGFQTEEQFGDWAGWIWLEVGFSLLFLVDILVRQRLCGFRAFFRGTGCAWNWFDTLLVAVGVAECALELAHGPDLNYSPMARFMRLLKLMRLARVFRLRFMRELQLMIKGLLGGARTLCWAIVLLVFVLYVLGVLSCTAFAGDPDEYIRELFESIPVAMFTTFRCVTGDCISRVGTSVLQSLVYGYGLGFALCFFGAYIAIALGVFNVILAIYVETTMTAAKQTEDANKGSKERASIRVAHLTKRLLKLFCAAERAFNGAGHGDRPSVKELLWSAGAESMEVLDNISISKELFLMVIQEPEVKKLMDELDLPPDRANLFDSIDADGSGSLEATELVRGLLKVRGEVKKSDQVACILALRAVQSTLRDMGANVQESRRMLEQLGLGSGASVAPGPASVS